MTLYSLHNQRPEPLPWRITLPSGFTRTDPSTFTDEEIQVAGFTGPFTEPPHDPATQSLDWIDGAYVVRDLPPPEPAADWGTFKRTALNSATLNQLLAAAYQSCPVAAGALAPALLRAEGNGAGDFAAAWATICASVPVPAEVIQGFIQVAQSCNLPAGFVSALGGQLTPPPATELGQEWSAPDGALWCVVRARDSDSGQFVGDDSGTVEKESLMWVRA